MTWEQGLVEIAFIVIPIMMIGRLLRGADRWRTALICVQVTSLQD